MLRLLQSVCESAGAFALLVAAGAYSDSYLTAHRALTRFESARAETVALMVTAPDQSSWSDSARRRYVDSSGDGGPAPVAVLVIERLRLKAPVFEGTDRLTLNRGVGWVEDTAFPGGMGNTVLSAHRDSFFRPLEDIRIGDAIELQTLAGDRHFTVEKTFITDPLDVSVLEPTNGPVLTLVTCHPFHYVGFAPNRFIVRAVPAHPPENRNATSAAIAHP